jgi:hypothetical protein
MAIHFLVSERGISIPVTREHLTLYAGPSQIIATALMFRLFIRSLADLSPGKPPERTDIAVLTAFPGPGILDCIEYVTKARTLNDGRLVIDTDAGPAKAPKALEGRFYFEVGVGPRRRGYWPSEGYFDQTFLDMVAAYQEGRNTAEEEAAYQSFKQQLIGRILGAPDKALFNAAEAA